MKTDVTELPATVPTKRHQIRKLLDLHIALWLAGDAITDAERELLTAEKNRRKNARPAVHVGVLVGREGMTPKQRVRVRGCVEELAPTSVLVVQEETAHREAVRVATIIIAAPKSNGPGGAVWEAIRYARHRKVPVRVVLPNGEEAA